MNYELDELQPHELWELLSHVPLHADEVEDSPRAELAREDLEVSELEATLLPTRI